MYCTWRPKLPRLGKHKRPTNDHNPRNPLYLFGAEDGIEPSMPLRTGDFESFTWLKIPLSLVPDDKGEARICQGKMMIDGWQELG